MYSEVIEMTYVHTLLPAGSKEQLDDRCTFGSVPFGHGRGQGATAWHGGCFPEQTSELGGINGRKGRGAAGGLSREGKQVGAQNGAGVFAQLLKAQPELTHSACIRKALQYAHILVDA